MKNLVGKSTLILVILAGCIWAASPPKERLRQGRDLRGGVSLIYSVRMPEGADREGLLAQTIDVLKDRVNPTGVLDIAMTPLGTNRIEIVMPLPSEEVKVLQQAYETRLETLLVDAEIRISVLDGALQAGRAPEVLGGGAGSRRHDLVTALQDTYDRLQSLREELDAAQARGDEAPGVLEQSVADTEIGFEDLHDAVSDLSLDRTRVVRMLAMPTIRKEIRDDVGAVVIDATTGEPLTRPSQRDTAQRELRTEFPAMADDLDALVAAHDVYQATRTSFDDPEDLIRLLKGAGVLEFRIAVRSDQPQAVNIDDMRAQLAEVGPENTDSTIARWFPLNDLKQWYDTPEQLADLQANPQAFFGSPPLLLVADEHDDEILLLLYTADARSMTHENRRPWAIESTGQTIDRLGRPAVSFRLDQSGGGLMSRLTGPHVNEPMAIVLDGQVYSAPTLQSQIGNSGIITGNFSQAELGYLVRVLAAGSLEARLSEDPIAINILGPSIGRENLRRGAMAFAWSLVAVAILMFVYYFFAGMVADLALVANGVIILGVMALIDGTFTLPGLAGVVLTMGMAVDANVLIYERIREELEGGARDLREAIREGYRRAFSTIIDANVTNLIVCFVLFRTATTEVKGFAVTLSIGIIATLFTSLFVTRVIYAWYNDRFRIQRLAMLPTVMPFVARLLHPSIDWIRLRGLFWAASLVAVAGSAYLVWDRGIEMFDTEFRGGVSITMRTARENPDDETSPRGLLPLIGPDSVQARLQALGDVVVDPTADPEEQERAAILRELRNVLVLTVGETTTTADGRVLSDAFQVKVASPRGLDDETEITGIIVEAVVDAFGEELEATPALAFAGAGSDRYADHTRPIEAKTLGEVIGRPRYHNDVSDFLGGVAIMVDGIDPPSALRDLEARIDRMRQHPQFAPDCAGRRVEVLGLMPDETERRFTSVAVVVLDPDLKSTRVDPNVFDSRVSAREWELVSAALQTPSSLEQVSSFSSAVARTLTANATVAVGLSLLGILFYIWIRFGSLWYSAAAIVALLHDVCIAMGALAMTVLLAETELGRSMLVEEFQIDLGVVAALLTVIGYSLNDTIVILDRIRENRGKQPMATAEMVNRSINQTFSRTALTSMTTLVAVLIIYIAGGSGIRPFAFCLLVGLVVGTYSSVAIASPMVFRRKITESAGR